MPGGNRETGLGLIATSPWPHLLVRSSHGHQFRPTDWSCLLDLTSQTIRNPGYKLNQEQYQANSWAAYWANSQFKKRVTCSKWDKKRTKCQQESQGSPVDMFMCNLYYPECLQRCSILVLGRSEAQHESLWLKSCWLHGHRSRIPIALILLVTY